MTAEITTFQSSPSAKSRLVITVIGPARSGRTHVVKALQAALLEIGYEVQVSDNGTFQVLQPEPK